MYSFRAFDQFVRKKNDITSLCCLMPDRYDLLLLCGCKCLIRLAVRQYVGTGTNVVASCNVHVNDLVSINTVCLVCVIVLGI